MRRSADDIRGRRRSRETAFLITGGTGFIGSHITAALLEQGHRVALLCRGSRGLSARERVDRLLDWFSLDRAKRERLDVVEGAITQPDMGLTRERYEALAGTTDEIVHCAASTSFSEKKRRETEAVNVEGTRNVLSLAAAGKCSFFHHVSTVFGAGMRGNECPEEIIKPARFLNVYEETKHRAELIARDACLGAGIRLNIYRPSIIYGDSGTGRSIRFNALYYPVKSLAYLRDLYERDIREHGGEKATAMGITRSGDGILHMPIRIEHSGEGALDLVPIDYFVRAFLALMEDCLEGDVFHIVCGKPTRFEELVEYTKQYFRVDGLRAVLPEEFAARPKTGLESLFSESIAAYLPYISDARTFRSEKATAVLKKQSLSCPEFDYPAFSRCMSYALSVDWGKKLFDPAPVTLAP